MKKNIYLILLIFFIFVPSTVFANVTTEQVNMQTNSIEFVITIFINLVITMLSYCIVPAILRLKNGKYDYEKGHKIVLINCVIVWIIFTIIKIANGSQITSGTVLIYYIVDKKILLKNKNEQRSEILNTMEKDNQNPFCENKKVEKKII